VNYAWLDAGIVVALLAMPGCTSSVPVPGFPAQAPAPAPLSPGEDIHWVFIDGMCAALDAGDSAKAGRLTELHNLDHPGAFPEALQGIASRCPHQVERWRRSLAGEPSTGESQLEYLCRVDPATPECNSWE